MSAGSYVCSFNDSMDRATAEANTDIYLYMFDSIHLLTHSGFEFQQSVSIHVSNQHTPMFKSVSPCRGRSQSAPRRMIHSSNLIHRSGTKSQSERY